MLTEVEALFTVYCKDCFLHKQLKKDHGRRHAHRFCITKCTVGEQLRSYGNRME